MPTPHPLKYIGFLILCFGLTIQTPISARATTPSPTSSITNNKSDASLTGLHLQPSHYDHIKDRVMQLMQKSARKSNFSVVAVPLAPSIISQSSPIVLPSPSGVKPPASSHIPAGQPTAPSKTIEQLKQEADIKANAYKAYGEYTQRPLHAPSMPPATITKEATLSPTVPPPAPAEPTVIAISTSTAALPPAAHPTASSPLPLPSPPRPDQLPPSDPVSPPSLLALPQTQPPASLAVSSAPSSQPPTKEESPQYSRYNFNHGSSHSVAP